MITRRPIAWSIVAASLAVMLVSGYLLAKRIEAWHGSNDRTIYYFVRTDQTSFIHAGREITFTPTLNDAGEGSILLTSRDARPESDESDESDEVDESDVTQLELPVQIPEAIPYPNLERFADWMGVFFFADSERRPFQEFQTLYRSGDIPVRCVVVVRDPNPGVAEEGRFNLQVDPNSWGYGEVQRNRWVFRFHELLPGGVIETTERVMPESGARFYRRQVAAYNDGEDQPQRAENELKEGTWRWDAALQIMPRPPAITKENQALLAAGWTLPVASASVLALIVSLAFAFAPERVTAAPQDDAEPDPEATTKPVA